MGTERSAAEEKCLETCSIVWSSTSNGTTNQNKTAKRRKERRRRKKRATDGAQQIRGGMRSFKSAKLLTSRARSRFNLTRRFSFTRSNFPQKVIKLAKISHQLAVINAIRISEGSRACNECVRVCSRETWTESKREERVKREFNTQNLKIIGFRCADCYPHKSLLVSGLQSELNV